MSAATYVECGSVSAAVLADAKSLSFFYGVGSNFDFLIAPIGGRVRAAAVGQAGKFSWFECTDNRSHNGVMVSDVAIKIDVASAAGVEDLTAGCLLRSGSQLLLLGADESSGVGRTGAMMLFDSLDHGSGFSVGFKRWKIVKVQVENELTLFEYGE